MRQRLHEVFFEADTPAGKAFDILLIASIASIALSVFAVMLDSIEEYRQNCGPV